jgi:hypothetical protein
MYDETHSRWPHEHTYKDARSLNIELSLGEKEPNRYNNKTFEGVAKKRQHQHGGGNKNQSVYDRSNRNPLSFVIAEAHKSTPPQQQYSRDRYQQAEINKAITRHI